LPPYKYRVSSTDSWEQLGEAGEQKVSATIPKDFSHFRNLLVPCQHGNDYEEIDLVAVGPTGIWSIEVKNWRGIAYPGDYPEELIFIRSTPDGRRTSTRDNPFYQARNHSQDLHSYLAKKLKEWFPPIHTLVVFVSRDPDGVNGADLGRVRHINPSIIYLEEMTNVLSDSRRIVQAWDKQHKVKDALGKLRTWDVIHFRNGEKKRGLLCQWSGLKIKSGGQAIPIRWEKVSRVEIIIGGNQGPLSTRFVLQSGDKHAGALVEDVISVQLPNGNIEPIKLAEIKEIYTGFHQGTVT
jgi:hypothetical protein